jgi:hypothetical protein
MFLGDRAENLPPQRSAMYKSVLASDISALSSSDAKNGHPRCMVCNTFRPSGWELANVSNA